MPTVRAILARGFAEKPPLRPSGVSSLDGLRRFTVFAEYNDCGVFVEEVDVEAVQASYAEKVARRVLDRHYDPGYRIVGVEERVGLYL